MGLFDALQRDFARIGELFQFVAQELYVGAEFLENLGNTPHSLATVILKYNHALPYNSSGVLYLPKSGATIYRISSLTANGLADLIRTVSRVHGFSIEFFLAALQQESCFSPKAFNPNHQHSPQHYSEWSPEEAFEMTDWGIGQFSGKQLPAIVPNLDKAPDRILACKNAALNPNWAVAQAAKKYAANLELARPAAEKYKARIQTALMGTKQHLDESEYPYFIAWMMYNSGVTGAMKILQSDETLPAHPFHCLTWYNQFLPFRKYWASISGNEG